jgi:hypothetical protein
MMSHSSIALLYSYGMGLMLATIWIHLGTDASTINDRLSVHFYSVAFLAFSKSSRLGRVREED